MECKYAVYNATVKKYARAGRADSVANSGYFAQKTPTQIKDIFFVDEPLSFYTSTGRALLQLRYCRETFPQDIFFIVEFELRATKTYILRDNRLEEAPKLGKLLYE